MYAGHHLSRADSFTSSPASGWRLSQMLRATFSTYANEWQTMFGPCSCGVTGLGSKCFGSQMVTTIMGIHLRIWM